MSAEDAFLHAIQELPDDDVPRLQYADWLEERGDPRGEFLRLECLLARTEKDNLRPSPLEARRQELWEAHLGGWVEQGGLALTWELALTLFRRRLEEAVAWCFERLGTLRTPSLQPQNLCWEPGTHTSQADRQRLSIVHGLTSARANLLRRQEPGTARDPRLIRRGKLLVFCPDATFNDGAAEVESAGFFDVSNIPAWDTWVWYARKADTSGGTNHYDSYLLCWVPPHLILNVDRGIEVEPVQCLRWAADLDTPLLNRLRTAGIGLPRSR